MNQIVGMIAESIPDTYTYHLIHGIHESNDEKAYSHLVQAKILEPDRLDADPWLMKHYERKGLKEDRIKVSKRLLNNDALSTSLLSYSYNVLMSVDRDGVLFTDGDVTTIPLWVLQDVLDVRNDVKIINLQMLSSQEYAHAVNDLLQVSQNDLGSGSISELIRKLSVQDNAREFYFALTLPKYITKDINSNLYVVGLAAQSSHSVIENLPILRKNIEEKFLMDYLTVDFNGEGQHASGRVFETNYLVPLIMLRDHYEELNQKENSEKLKKLILNIAERSDKKEVVLNFLRRSKNTNIKYKPADIKTKSIEKSMNLIKGNIYAYATEVTNMQYQEFLQYLKDNGYDDVYEMAQIDLSEYEEPALSMVKNYHAMRPSSKSSTSFSNHPVVHISHQAALEYCKWLTAQYNMNKDRKFKKVVFRLPEINEWQMAALGYHKFQSWVYEENKLTPIIDGDMSNAKHPYVYAKEEKAEAREFSLRDHEVLYPWGFQENYMNAYGCYLGNFKVPAKSNCPNGVDGDGFVAQGPVGSYFTNNFDLYDVVGNVAEMTSIDGKACGGSWNHPPDQSTIRSINEYDGPSPEIGFRIFMEVLEY